MQDYRIKCKEIKNVTDTNSVRYLGVFYFN